MSQTFNRNKLNWNYFSFNSQFPFQHLSYSNWKKNNQNERYFNDNYNCRFQQRLSKTMFMWNMIVDHLKMIKVWDKMNITILSQTDQTWNFLYIFIIPKYFTTIVSLGLQGMEKTSSHCWLLQFNVIVVIEKEKIFSSKLWILPFISFLIVWH